MLPDRLYIILPYLALSILVSYVSIYKVFHASSYIFIFDMDLLITLVLPDISVLIIYRFNVPILLVLFVNVIILYIILDCVLSLTTAHMVHSLLIGYT